MNQAAAIPFGVLDALPDRHINVPLSQVSWPKLFVPRYRGDFKKYVNWWKRYITYHFKTGADLLAFVPAWILFTIGYSTTIRNAKMQAIENAIDAGATGGLCAWYDGVRPATGGAVTVLLATLIFSVTAGVVAAGVLTFSAITSGNAVATSTVTWGRVTDDAATFCFDFSIAAAAADINVNTTAIVTGAACSITSWTITDGNP